MEPENRPPDSKSGDRDGETDPWIDEVLDSRYRILSLIGRGGMGRVYRAEHVAIRRQVAIKLFSPDACGALINRQRFAREAFASGRVTHPNCVAVSDFGTLRDGTLFLAMELLDGVSLATLIAREERLPLARSLHIMKHVLRGLGHAHDSGIVHRDLKPQNVILVDHLGDPDFAKVLDFGLAKLIGGALLEEGGGKLTQAGITFGTPTYMAPEQALGKSLDHRADLYSASIMLFEMLTGEPPFRADDPQRVLMMHATNPVPRLRDVAPTVEVPVDLELLIRRGLAKRPSERPESAEGYIAAVERCEEAFAETEPALAEPSVSAAIATPITSATAPLRPPLQPTPAQRAQQSAALSTPFQSPRRRVPLSMPALLATAGVLLVVVLAIAFTAGSGEQSGQPAPSQAPSQLGAATRGGDTLNDLDAEALEDLAEAEAALRAGELATAETTLRALRRKYPESARIAYLLGNLYHQKPYPPEAIKSYRDAIRLDPDYRQDETLIENAIATLLSQSSHRAAANLLERDIGAPAVPYLERTAEDSKNPKVRQRARDILNAIASAELE